MLMRTSNDGVEPGNQFLRLLSRGDRALLDGKLERVTVEPGQILLSVGDPIHTVYFPESVVVSIERQAGASQHIETAVVGYEGVVGWSGIIGVEYSPQRAVVQMRPGTAMAISIGELCAACSASSTLLAALVRFIAIVMEQMAQAIVSHLRDPIDRRLSRWLLMRHDRLPYDQLVIRHDEISRNLGSRRASVTDCLHVLEGERLIRAYRGRIVVRDRIGLEARAGDSYGGAEADYHRLIGPFGRSPARAALDVRSNA